MTDEEFKKFSDDVFEKSKNLDLDSPYLNDFEMKVWCNHQEDICRNLQDKEPISLSGGGGFCLLYPIIGLSMTILYMIL